MIVHGLTSYLAASLSLPELLRLSVYFTFIFAIASIIFWRLPPGCASTAIAWILAILSIGMADYFAYRGGFEIVSEAGVGLTAYYVFFGFALAKYGWNGIRLLLSLNIISLGTSIGLAFADGICNANHISALGC